VFCVLTKIINISKQYSSIELDLLDSFKEGLFLFDENNNNPNLNLQNANVSRYTFLEYLRFLIFNIQKEDSSYVNALNAQILVDYSSTVPKSADADIVGQITLELLKKATEEFSAEYKGNNWALAGRNDIFNANNSDLWAKVDNSWL